MFRTRGGRSVAVVGTVAAVPLLLGGFSGPAQAAPAAARAAAPAAGTGMADAAGAGVMVAGGASRTAATSRTGYHRFSHPTRITNPWFPLVAGTEYRYTGTVVEEGRAKEHSVVFTVTDLTKVIGGVRTIVVWDRDYRDGDLQEAELAFFAQDDAGNVWNFGEYPEEFDNGRFTGAPSTWITGIAGAVGGRHMLARPALGTSSYLEGKVPAIDFYDMSHVIGTNWRMCVPIWCSRHVLVVDEWSPNDEAGGHQIKYYAPGIGLIRVSARGGDSREYLKLTGLHHLRSAARAQVRAAALRMERRAYRVSSVYRHTRPAQYLH